MRRAARYYLYRKYVLQAHGFLGAKVRVRIPRCVVEHIRSRFREPGCDCQVGGPLYNCTAHGYTGHRDADENELVLLLLLHKIASVRIRLNACTT